MYLKVEIDDNKLVFNGAGSVEDYCSMLSIVTNCIYENLKDEEAKDEFKFAIKKGFEDDVPFIKKRDVMKKAIDEIKDMSSEELEALLKRLLKKDD